MSFSATRSLCLSLCHSRGAAAHGWLHAAHPEPGDEACPGGAAAEPVCRLLSPEDAGVVSLIGVAPSQPGGAHTHCICNDAAEDLLLLDGQYLAAGDLHLRIAGDQIIPARQTLAIDHTIVAAPAAGSLEITLRSVPARPGEIVTGLGPPPRQAARRRSRAPGLQARTGLDRPIGLAEVLDDGRVRIEAAGHPAIARLPAAGGFPVGAPDALTAARASITWPEDLLTADAWRCISLSSGAVRCEFDDGATMLRSLVWRNAALVIRGLLSRRHATLMGLV